MTNVKLYDEYDEDDVLMENGLPQEPDEDEKNNNSSDSEDNEISVTQSPVETEEDEETEYKVSSITNNFLRLECGIKHESAKTMIKFSYRGSTYKGIVMQKFPNSDDNYVFLVQFADKSASQGKPNPKVMKKIYIPDASLIK